MTQHANPQDTIEDQATMRRLALVIGSFFALTAIGAVIVGMVMG